MERRDQKKQGEDSDEMAAALAAIYAYCLESESDDSETEGNASVKSNWAGAGRLEGLHGAAGKISGKTQLNGKYFSWRNSFARKWTSLSVAFLALSCLQLPEAAALERIQFTPAPSGEQLVQDDDRNAEESSWRPVLPMSPLMKATVPNLPSTKSAVPATETAKAAVFGNGQSQAGTTSSSIAIPPRLPLASVISAGVAPLGALAPVPSPVTVSQDVSGANTELRVALNTSCAEGDLVLPDGGLLRDEVSGKLLAELPSQTRWLVSTQSGSNGRRLAFEGRTANSVTTRTLLESGFGNYEQATYTRSFKSSVKGGFSRPPYVLDSSHPRFSLPIKNLEAAPLSTKAKSPVQAASYRTSSINVVSAKGATLHKLASSVVSPQASTIAIPKQVLPPPVVNGYIISPGNPSGVISFAGKTYRGRILLKPRNGEESSFLVINLVDLEDYLLSVVPSEMPASWSLNALKAQTIAARSYAVANRNKHQREGYDVKANTEDQVYLGVQSENEQSNRAVADTTGQVLKHNGKVVTAFFHSSGGGSTELPEHVYGGKVPYLKSVPDFDDQSPHFAWNRSIPVQLIEDNLKKQGRDIGGLLGIFPLEHGQSQRVSSAMIAGTLQTILISGEELRKIMSLPSTVFNVGVAQDAYLVAGRGFGHGLGMSQWGAKFLSEQGYNAAQILSYYYKDVSVEQF